jgi:hypothetical protein
MFEVIYYTAKRQLKSESGLLLKEAVCSLVHQFLSERTRNFEHVKAWAYLLI